MLSVKESLVSGNDTKIAVSNNTFASDLTQRVKLHEERRVRQSKTGSKLT